jgi:hypothetical protein
MSLGRPKTRWENNISIGLEKIGWEFVGLIYLARERNSDWFLNTVMDFCVP